VLPEAWHDPQLGDDWETIRAIRRRITVPIEDMRRANTLGSSLQAAVVLPLSAEHVDLLSDETWAEVAIVSVVRTERGESEPAATIMLAPGAKCARCWRVLEEVGTQAAHPALCLRCTDAVESGLVCRPA